jgi:hypothetical protein
MSLQPLPAGADVVYPSSDPAVPSIMLVQLSGLFFNLGLFNSLNIPLTPAGGAHARPSRYGRGIFVVGPDSQDFDTDPTVAQSRIGILQVS